MTPPARLDWDVLVDVPAESRYARVARTAAATCAALEGFDIDELGDVRLLVDEVFVAMVEGGARRIELRVTLGGGRLVLELVGPGDPGVIGQCGSEGFVRVLADTLATDVTIELDRDPPRFAATMAAR